MKLKKIFSFTDKRQIWRLLISSSDKLIIETRDTEKKEVFFNCLDLQKGKKIFKNFQLEEKFWIGIEALYKDYIFFHLYAKPNMPEHKSIIAFDIASQKNIWQNDEFAFLTVYDEKVYVFKRKFEGQDVYALDYQTGETVQEFGSDLKKVQPIINLSKAEEDFSNYIYPEQLLDSESDVVKEIVNKELEDKNTSEMIEYIKYDNFLIFNYYIKHENNLLDNIFVVYNIDKRKKIVSDIINKYQSSFTPDSFFMYKNLLLLLKNKTEIITYKIN